MLTIVLPEADKAVGMGGDVVMSARGTPTKGLQMLDRGIAAFPCCYNTGISLTRHGSSIAEKQMHC